MSGSDLDIRLPSNSQTTGSFLILFAEDNQEQGIKTIQKVTGFSEVIKSSDFTRNRFNASRLASSEPIFFDTLGVAIVNLDSDQIKLIDRAIKDDSNPIIAIESERIVYAISEMPPTEWIEYLKGYRDAVNHITDRLIADSKAAPPGILVTDMGTTWGLQVTKVINSPYSGKGVKVAILDTGLDLEHPDFSGRTIVSQSFIENETVQDVKGHGTHCAGTACGSKSSMISPRYGVAHNAEIYIGKVLDNAAGRGSDRGIIAGIEWALNNGCQVISLSLTADTTPGQSYSRVYETLAQRALQNGAIVIAAAGNASRRPTTIQPVGHPANCPSIMAVAAIDARFQVASFSNGSINRDGGQIDITAPGVDIYSSVPMPKKFDQYDGTSMATPHVAGIAALYIEAAQARGETMNGYILWTRLIQNALRLSLSAADIGNGLVQAPL